MKYNTMEKLYHCLLTETPEITLPENIIKDAYKPVQKMLDLSKELNIIK